MENAERQSISFDVQRLINSKNKKSITCKSFNKGFAGFLLEIEGFYFFTLAYLIVLTAALN